MLIDMLDRYLLLYLIDRWMDNNKNNICQTEVFFFFFRLDYPLAR